MQPLSPMKQALEEYRRSKEASIVAEESEESPMKRELRLYRERKAQQATQLPLQQESVPTELTKYEEAGLGGQIAGRVSQAVRGAGGAVTGLVDLAETGARYLAEKVDPDVANVEGLNLTKRYHDLYRKGEEAIGIPSAPGDLLGTVLDTAGSMATFGAGTISKAGKAAQMAGKGIGEIVKATGKEATKQAAVGAGMGAAGVLVPDDTPLLKIGAQLAGAAATRKVIAPRDVKTAHVNLRHILKHKDFAEEVTSEMVRNAFNKAEELIKLNPKAKVDLSEALHLIKTQQKVSTLAHNNQLAKAYTDLYLVAKQGNTAEVAYEMYSLAKGLASNLADNNKPDIANVLRAVRGKIASALSNSENKEIASTFSEAIKSSKVEKLQNVLNSSTGMGILNDSGTGVDIRKLAMITASKEIMADLKKLFPTAEQYNYFKKSGKLAQDLIRGLEEKKGSPLARLAPPAVGSAIGAFFGGKLGTAAGAGAGQFLSKPVMDQFISVASLTKKYLRLLNGDAPVSTVRSLENELMNALIHTRENQDEIY